MFSYWDRADVSPINEFILEWRAHLPNFRIFGDAEVESMIVQYFPEYQEMFRSIRIPTCKSDLALLLVLYAVWWSPAVDCHCGVRDPEKVAHPAVPGWSICSMRVPCAGDQRRAGGTLGG